MLGVRLLFLAILLAASAFGNFEDEVSCSSVSAVLIRCFDLALFDGNRGWERAKHSATPIMKEKKLLQCLMKQL